MSRLLRDLPRDELAQLAGSARFAAPAALERRTKAPAQNPLRPGTHTQARRLGVHRFTAELEGKQVFLRPERGDNEASLAALNCNGASPGKLAGAERIDVTACLPKGVPTAIGSSPENCAAFVKSAVKGKKASPTERDTFLTPELWGNLLREGGRVTGAWRIDEKGKLSPAKDKRVRNDTPQSTPRIGDLAFMAGRLSFPEGEPRTVDPEGRKFRVNWDHVAIFLARDRQGRDWHLAKDGDENPLGVYHTGMKAADTGLTPGAYEAGGVSLLMYMTPPPAQDWQDAGAGRPR